MGCPSCSADNPTEARFCMSCGAALAATCSACGQSNPPIARFCMQCGGSLTPTERATPSEAASAVSSRTYTPPHLADKILASREALEGERKQVTVLFADITGSTELIQDLDPEEAKALLEPAVRAMIEAVHRFEGTVCRVMGDGIMALFGAPLAHEDHAARACYAALTMQEAIRHYGEQARGRNGVEVLARVGLNSGEVVVGSISNDLHVEYSAIGATTHLAARMEQLAVPGTVRLTGETLRLVEGLVEARPLGRIPVKGLAEPVEAFELTGAGPSRRRFQAATVRGLTPFVGRQAELEALQRALDLAREGHGQIVAPVGEPGVGKSRLFYEFLHSHRTAGCLVLESGSVSYGKATSYLPVIDLLKAYCRIEPRADARTAREKLTGKLLTLDRSLEKILPPLLALLDLPVEDAAWTALDPPQRRRQTIDAVKRLLLRESQEQPLLLVFEDLHWIDSETQALLDSLVESLPTARVLLLVNYRPEYTHAWGNKSYYAQLRIDPLGQETAEELLDALLGDHPTVQPLKPLLIGRTEGNPFFLEESVRALVETGALVGERGAYRLTRAIDDVRVPAAVQAVSAARIDRLPAAEKRLLQTAAVIGKDVTFALLHAIADTPDAELHAGLSQLQAAELLYAVRLFPELEYTFKHALTHEVAYGSLLQERRRALHARIVEAIERLYPDRQAEHVERLAHHALRAESWEQAVTYSHQAGLKAVARSANREAVAYFEQVLAALGHLPESCGTLEQGIDVRLDLRQALVSLGEVRPALEHVHEAETMAEALGDQRRLGRALSFAAFSFFILGEYERAIETGERALAIGRTLDDLSILAVVTHYLAFPYRLQGDYRRAIDVSRWVVHALQGELVRERYGVGGYPAMASRASLALCMAELGDFPEGMAHGEDGVRLAERLGHPYSQGASRLCLGFLYLRQGHLAIAISLLEQCLELFERWDLPQLVPEVRAILGTAYIMNGRPTDGMPLLEQAAAELDVRAVGVLIPHVMLLTQGYLLADRIEEASRFAGSALDTSRLRKERGLQADTFRLLGEIALRRDSADVEQAEAYYRQALTLAEELEMRPLQAHCHLGLGKLYRRIGQVSDARAELSTAVAMLREMGMTYWLPEAEAELSDVIQ